MVYLPYLPCFHTYHSLASESCLTSCLIARLPDCLLACLLACLLNPASNTTAPSFPASHSLFLSVTPFRPTCRFHQMLYTENDLELIPLLPHGFSRAVYQPFLSDAEVSELSQGPLPVQSPYATRLVSAPAGSTPGSTTSSTQSSPGANHGTNTGPGKCDVKAMQHTLYQCSD